MSGLSTSSPPAQLTALPTPLDLERSGLDLCVHCGFCLPACPTYLAVGDENDSPRGRLVLMRALAEGAVEADDSTIKKHLDRCLGCRGCESACPSGVPYGRLLEASRATLIVKSGASPVARLILSVFSRPALLRIAMFGSRVIRDVGIARLLSKLPGRIGFSFAMLESTRRVRRRSATGNRQTHNDSVAATQPQRTAVLLRGCVMEGLLAPVNEATDRVLHACGVRSVDAPGQRCCGALHAHAGDIEGARKLARANIVEFEDSGAEFFATNSAGCGAMLKEYGHLLASDPEFAERASRLSSASRDISELVAESPFAPPFEVRKIVTCDAPCHLQHAQRIVSAPNEALARISGLTNRPLPDSDQCCGGAGIFTLLEADLSQTILDKKLHEIRSTGAEYLLTGNPGCLMQIGAGLSRAGDRIEARHPVELLDEALTGTRRER